MRKVRHLYLHVPFCRRHCPYCDFAVTAEASPEAEGWLAAVGHELTMKGGDRVLAPALDTLLVGGGTPSYQGRGRMQGIRRLLGARLEGIREWTGESNPEDVEPPLLRDWIGAGVTRINVGIQSTRPAALAWLGRAHGVADGEMAMRRLAGSGLLSWGVDLLYGLPSGIDPDPLASVEAALSHGAPHISLYELIAEPGTPLGARVASEPVGMADEDLRADQYLSIGALLAQEGYEAYEMTGFALPGHESKHATAILDGEDCLGLGPGAHSSLGGRRSWNMRDWPGYLEAIGAGRTPVADGEVLSADSIWLERVWSRLRSSRGVAREELTDGAWMLRERWVRQGLAHPDPARVRLTPEGWLRLDGLVLELTRTQSEARPDRGAMEGGK